MAYRMCEGIFKAVVVLATNTLGVYHPEILVDQVDELATEKKIPARINLTR